MEERTALADLIRRARRRLGLHLVFNALGDACAVFLAGLTLAFILGTAILGWPFFAALAVAAVTLGALRARAGIGSPYRTAQKIDRGLGMPDSLSTALYFSKHPVRPGQSEIVNHQRQEAERAARSADVSHAFPFAASRGLYASAALLFAAGGVFFLRYGITHQLNLRAPLVHLAFGPGAAPDPAPQNVRKPLAGRRDIDLPGAIPAPWDAAPLDNHQAPNNMLDASGAQDGNTLGAPDRPGATSKSGNVKSEMAGSKPGDGSSPDASDSARNSADAPPSGKPDQSQSASGKGGSQSQGNSQGLMDRMKDAMSDLLSSLKPNANKQEGSSQSKSGGASQSGAQRQASSNTAQTANNAERAAQEANAQGEAGAQSGQKTEAASKGRAGDSASAHNDSPDAKSGIGSQDGNKDSKYAGQLAAMGKISELIGKRSANVTGEVMVEVASGNQQLKTQYSNRAATHSDAGGEIDRDEVPLAYQQYVQQYFEEIRKSPPARSGASGVKQ